MKSWVTLCLAFCVIRAQDSTVPADDNPIGDLPADQVPKGEELPDLPNKEADSSAEKSPAPDPELLKKVKLGMTWGYGHKFLPWEIVFMSCYGGGISCNAYQGDTPCSTRLPLLCLKPAKYMRPPYPIVCGPHAMPGPFYCGWTGGFWNYVPNVLGWSLTSRAVADAICANYLGPGYRMAEHHDGYWIDGMSATAFHSQTWNFSATGGWAAYAIEKCRLPKGRYWTAINDQPANCWN